ncbi:MAG: tetratricopeptide repeat protein [Candidatus Eisenbacteria bacterium]|uniref:Tetratricopeptide repeat protein n=1 Tax=Eiseniibacteriota bacterium TaxID=2212470 RepID=A0A956M227_UNCEI|nr:tetratricopeptide repeat protein [Candidatus Eisenbacteria bacterium]
MVVAKKMTKEELREDKVLTGLKELATFIQRNLRYVIGAVALVALVVIGVSLWNQSRVRSEQSAGLAMSQAQQLFFAGNFAEALSRFQGAASQFGSAPAARTANLYIGNCQLSLGNPTEAEKSFRDALGKAGGDPLLRAGALRGIGGALADQGKPAEGAASYEQAAQIEGNPLAADDWFAAGNGYAEGGDRQQAEKAYQKIIDDFPRSSHLMDAKLKLAELKAR